jgi:hypothetical protein
LLFVQSGIDPLVAITPAECGLVKTAVKVRVERKKPEEKEAKRPGSEATVEVTAETPGSIDIVTDFLPERIVVDPDVELLFAGRKRAETALAAP